MFRKVAAPVTFTLLLLAGCASGPDVKVDAEQGTVVASREDKAD